MNEVVLPDTSPRNIPLVHSIPPLTVHLADKYIAIRVDFFGKHDVALATPQASSTNLQVNQ